MGVTNKPDCKRLTICAAPDLATFQKAIYTKGLPNVLAS